MRKTIVILLLIVAACKENKQPLVESLNELNLKRGEVVSCGPPDKEFGTVGFDISCSEKVKKDFDLAIALLHSFEYDEAEKVFVKIIDEEPDCAIAYWGAAMANYHPLWAPPTRPELEKGAKLIAIARSNGEKSGREEAYINAMATFYKDWQTVDHRKRSLAFEQAMEKVYNKFPADKEAAVFYALTITAAADPADKTYSRQKKAVDILNKIYPGQPNHPGIVHYLIHSYDYPALAQLALAEARKYAAIAPSSAHAQHMPSHIFTRLGLWQECINSNKDAAESAKCYAESTGIKGHWDEELHALDYLVYGYLQQGDNDSAKKQLDYLHSIKEVSPVNFKVAYAFAASPARFLLENKMWKEAATLRPYPANFAWEQYPWQKAIIHFTRLLGSAHTGRLDSARYELKMLHTMRDTLSAQKDAYKVNQVQIQINSGEAWILFKEGKNNEALQMMTLAADMEDKTQKHSVTPGEVIPARELLGDMLMAMDQPAKAQEAYEADLKEHAGRFNGLYGAGLAAERSKNTEKANLYYSQLMSIAKPSRESRPELEAVRKFQRLYAAVQ